MKKGRIFAIDHGTRRIGTAFSDTGWNFAFPHKVFEEEDALFDYLLTEHAGGGIATIVVGLPLNMDGTEGPRAEEVRSFGRRLENAVGCAVVFFDERLTSFEAENILQGHKKRGIEGKKQVDLVSAHIILRTYLASLGNKG